MMLILTLVVLFLVCCMLEVRCGWTGVVSGLSRAPDDGHSNARNMLNL